MRRRSRTALFALIATATLVAAATPAPAGAAAAPPPISFTSARFHTAGRFGGSSLDNNGTAAADLDGDGNQDVAMIAPWLGSRVHIAWGRGNGTFSNGVQTVWAGVLNSNVILGDFDQDGRTDLVVTGSSSFTVVRNRGGRRFTVGATYPLQQSPFQNSGGTTDFTGDGRLDLALKTPLGIQVMTGDGDATFGYGPFSYVPGVPGALASIDDADLDGDAHRDLVASDAATQQVFALRNNGSGAFSVRSRATVPLVPTTVRAGDLDGSGVDSIVVLPEVSPPSHSAAVVLNDGTGGLRLHAYYPAGFANPVGEIADLNGDGTLDVVSVNTVSGNLVLLAGRGDGTFVPAGTIGTASRAQTPALTDLDGDGRTDIAVPTSCPGLSGLLGNTCIATVLNRS